MIAVILMKKICSLFLIMGMGAILVRLKILKANESKVLSLLSLYLIMPCMILTSFQVECTKEVQSGLLLALIAAIVAHVILLILSVPLKRIWNLDAVEVTSLIYSNAAGLIIPLILAILGKEWVIYTSPFVCVQLFLLWSHGKSVLCGEKGIDLRKVFMNINMISVLIGIILFATGIRFPAVVSDAIESVGNMMGPVGMLVTGMLIGSMDMKKIFSYKRLLLVVPLRLVGLPLLILLVFKFSGVGKMFPNGDTILMISLLATMTPSASTIMQMAQIYDKDADYASVINVATTILCILTMPLLIALYQL
ncbi:AEC family transporter [Brotaphodocola sp.]|uniref:AEC family transporter n=1 Tax=Brotaphodocola sp. TaxID=3073577 RepID=UPI003D7E0185